MQYWAEEHDTEWRCMSPKTHKQKKNGILKQQIKLLTGKITLAGLGD